MTVLLNLKSLSKSETCWINMITLETQLDEKFYFLDLKIYEINDGFPKVSRQEIPNTAVLNVKYSIDTSLLSEFQIETPIQDLICHG